MALFRLSWSAVVAWALLLVTSLLSLEWWALAAAVGVAGLAFLLSRTPVSRSTRGAEVAHVCGLLFAVAVIVAVLSFTVGGRLRGAVDSARRWAASYAPPNRAAAPPAPSSMVSIGETAPASSRVAPPPKTLNVARQATLVAEPSMTSALVALVWPPSEVEIVESRKSGWIKIRSQNSIGWVKNAKGLLTSRAGPMVCRVVGDQGNVEVHGSANVAAAVAALAGRGNRFFCREAGGEGGEWVRIDDQRGIGGWVPRSELMIPDTARAAPKAVRSPRRK